MSKLNSCKGKHLNLEDRIFIEYALDEQYTLKEIAKRVGKDPTTISKEIKRNRVLSSKKNRTQFLRCINQKSCKKKQLCRETCTNLCKKCTMINCYRHCLEYSTKKCVKLDRFPYVCNGCTTASMCQNERYQYRSKVADANYKDILEYDANGNRRANVFYCDPMASYQEPHIEKNHEYIRYIIPKGKSLNKFSKEQMKYISNLHFLENRITKSRTNIAVSNFFNLPNRKLQ